MTPDSTCTITKAREHGLNRRPTDPAYLANDGQPERPAPVELITAFHYLDEPGRGTWVAWIGQGDMSYQGEYTIVDVRASSPSQGKILVVLDDEAIAQEMAAEMRRQRCQVVVRPVVNKRTLLIEPAPAGALEATGT